MVNNMPKKNNKNPVLAIYFDSEDDKEMCRNMLWHLKYKTGKNNWQILRESLMKYNMEE